MTTNQLFVKFVAAMFTIMILFGLGMMSALFWANDAIAFRMVNAFVAMFTGVLGLGSGFLLGTTRAD